jgi:cystathionine beta-lyase/cystathionine gamma-synthase
MVDKVHDGSDACETINRCMTRLSIGTEGVDDLSADLDQALGDNRGGQ